VCHRGLRVLLIGGAARDELLLRRKLVAGGYLPQFEVADSATGLRSRLVGANWDLLIADVVGGGFDAAAALKALQSGQFDVPLLVVSSARGEDHAVSAMRAGASDYLSKRHLATLAPVVDRILHEGEQRRAGREAERAVRDREQQALLELATAYEATVEGWSNALDLRDRETDGHSRRVTELTVRLAQKLGVSDAEIVHIRRGALLHDIGKMGVPDAILHKPAALTRNEWEIMRRHPGFARQLLAPIEYLWPALDIPYAHHEKWDGTGYPRGLKGEQIPLAARIFAAVDIWDAIRSDRPYRAAWTAERSRAHLVSLSGTHLDPDVVTAFLALLGQEDDAAARESVDAGAAPEPRSARILVVDDYAANVKLLKRWLGGDGYDVATASSGREALAAVASQRPDLVLLDILIPEPDGVTVCRTLKADADTASIPVIFMSGMEASSREADARQLADDYIAKPIDVYELRARVRNRLERGQKL
jgi:response regulator RpfG family c-di-GMP phosphodiesterase